MRGILIGDQLIGISVKHGENKKADKTAGLLGSPYCYYLEPLSPGSA